MTTADEQTQPDEPVKRTVLYELSRKVLLAPIGGAAIASEEIAAFVNRLAERGELAEKDARRLITEVLETRTKLEQEQKAEHDRQKAAAYKEEISSLTARIAELSKRIEELKKERGPVSQES